MGSAGLTPDGTSPPAPGFPLAVVHLVLREFGPEPLRDFLASYRRHAAGCPHDLVIAAKQFADAAAFAPWDDLLAGVPHRMVHVSDAGFDLGSYLAVAQATAYPRYCFLNSRSVILADGWLAKLATAADAVPHGIVGATGSFESVASDAFTFRAYFTGWLRGLLGCLKLLVRFPAFPNPHLRTNAFMVARTTLLALDWPRIRDKVDSFRFESGRRGLTRQIVARGGAALLVDADGNAYRAAQWPRSGTFWQGDQPRLLVGDKQTAIYRDADAVARSAMRLRAWGRDQPRHDA